MAPQRFVDMLAERLSIAAASAARRGLICSAGCCGALAETQRRRINVSRGCVWDPARIRGVRASRLREAATLTSG